MGGAGSTKRIKELKRQERNQEKAAEKERRRRAKADKPHRAEGEEDPDIAGIVPGPQAPIEAWGNGALPVSGGVKTKVGRRQASADESSGR